ncbi:MAG: PAS domain S-box protein [Candidatus Eremiobacteraeota bacterium]|nr:PAS domain S-box protein [Candidatus Eremiobacteraeota bacterium]
MPAHKAARNKKPLFTGDFPHTEDFLHSIINSMAEPVFVKDDQHRWILINEAYCELVGYSREELLGKSDYDFYLKREADVFWKNDSEMLSTGKVKVNEEDFTDRSGRYHVIRTRKSLYIDSSGRKFIVGIIIDITERRVDEEKIRKLNADLAQRVELRTEVIEAINKKLVEEIAERIDAEKALRDSRNYLDKMINTIADPIFVKDKRHRWVLLNDAYCAFMGYTREELLGKTDFDFFPHKEAKVFWEKDEEVFRTGVENVNEEQFTDRGGKTHTIITKKTLYKDSSGTMSIVGIIRDSSEQKLIEEKLKESEQKYRALFESSPDAILVLDDGGIIRDINVRGAAMFCSSIDELKGKHFKEIRRLTEKSKDMVIEAFSRRMKGEIIAPYRIDFTDAEGRARVGRVTAVALLNGDNLIRGIVVMVADISDMG